MTDIDDCENAMDYREIDRVTNEEMMINEEYKTWKKHSPLLYDIIVTHALEWPTLTAQWFPDVERPEDKDYTVHRLLLGTHTSDNDQNYLQIAHVQLPRQDESAIDSSKYDEDRCEFGGYGAADCKFSVKQRIPHDGEVNRARYMPQKPDIIGTKTIHGDVHIFDRTRFTSEPSEKITCQPTIQLKGHSMEGYGINWCGLKSGHIISGAEDRLVCHWDLQQVTKESNIMDPFRVYRGHTSAVGDVCWHKRIENIFSSVGDDRMLMIWDSRSPDSVKPSQSVRAHEGEIISVDFNPCSDFLLATGANDRSVRLWDLRAFSKPLHTMVEHASDVVQVSWHPFEGHILASASNDRRVLVWDLTKIGDEQTPEDAEDGPPELMFMHAGHTNKVSDIAWNLNIPWVMASCAEDNIVQIWQIARNLYSTELDSGIKLE